MSWPGGFRGEVLVAVWMPNAAVVLNFHPPYDGSSQGINIAQPHNARLASGACDLSPTRGGRGPPPPCTFLLGSLPDESHGFGFVARGGPGARAGIPTLSCDTVQSGAGGGAAPASPLPPPMPPIVCRRRGIRTRARRRTMTVVDQWPPGIAWRWRRAIGWRAPGHSPLLFALDLQLLSSGAHRQRRRAPARPPSPSASNPTSVCWLASPGAARAAEPSDVTCASVSAADIVKVSAASSSACRRTLRVHRALGDGFEADVHVRTWRPGSRLTSGSTISVGGAAVERVARDGGRRRRRREGGRRRGRGENATAMAGGADGEEAFTFFRVTARVLPTTATPPPNPDKPQLPQISCEARRLDPPPPPPPPLVASWKNAASAMEEAEAELARRPAGVRVERSGCASVSLAWDGGGGGGGDDEFRGGCARWRRRGDGARVRDASEIGGGRGCRRRPTRPRCRRALGLGGRR